jgi:hypothetical protein
VFLQEHIDVHNCTYILIWPYCAGSEICSGVWVESAGESARAHIYQHHISRDSTYI